MPLIAHNGLPTYERLRSEGTNILPHGRAITQDIRELHIGLLNMMPDAAFIPTERQFMKLIGESNQIVQFYMHLFTLPEIKRSQDTQDYIDQYYTDFESLQNQGLDALIITGANVADPDLTRAVFWEPLQDVMGWAWDNVTSTLTACLATHAVMQFKYGMKRKPLHKKHVGVFRSRVKTAYHPVVSGTNTVFDVPHSRHNTITIEEFRKAGMHVLVNSHEGGVHMACSPDGLRLICCQGHQEYETTSIMKEYKRDMLLYLEGTLKEKPDIPKHYFTSEALELIQDYEDHVLTKKMRLEFPDEAISENIENTWRDTARAVFSKWIGNLYQVTNMDRTKPFMDGVNPDDPLGIRDKL